MSLPNQSFLEDLILTFRRKILESMRAESLKHDLSFSQTEILRFIGLNEKKTMKSIAEHLKITPPSASVLVAHMEKRGLVRRTSDPVDRRVVWITLVPKTKKLIDSACKKKQLIFKGMLSKLTEKDQKELERIISILIKE
ncbi:MAG: MarR family transcriptional regulator [bacterium]